MTHCPFIRDGEKQSEAYEAARCCSSSGSMLMMPPRGMRRAAQQERRRRAVREAPRRGERAAKPAHTAEIRRHAARARSNAECEVRIYGAARICARCRFFFFFFFLSSARSVMVCGDMRSAMLRSAVGAMARYTARGTRARYTVRICRSVQETSFVRQHSSQNRTGPPRRFFHQRRFYVEQDIR